MPPGNKTTRTHTDCFFGTQLCAKKLQQGVCQRWKLISRTISTSDENLSSITTRAVFPSCKTCSQSGCRSHRSNSISSDCRRATSVNILIIKIFCLQQTIRARTQICSVWKKNALTVLLTFNQSKEKKSNRILPINVSVPITAAMFSSNICFSSPPKHCYLKSSW